MSSWLGLFGLKPRCSTIRCHPLRFHCIPFTLINVLIQHSTTCAFCVTSALHCNLRRISPTHSSALDKRSRGHLRSTPSYHFCFWLPSGCDANLPPFAMISGHFCYQWSSFHWIAQALLIPWTNNHPLFYCPPSMRILGDLVKYCWVA